MIVGGGIAGVLAGAQLRKAGVERIRIVDQAGGIGRHLVLEPLPGRDVRRRVVHLPADARGARLRPHPALRVRRGDPPAPPGDRRPLRPRAATPCSTPGSPSASGTRTPAAGGSAPTGATSCPLPLLRAGRRDPQPPEAAGHPRHGGLRAAAPFHTARWDYDYTGGGPGEPLTKLGDKVVALIGTGATGIQCVPPLAEAAKHVYVFQRTPSAIGVRGNRPTDPDFADGLGAGLAAGPDGQLPGDHAGPEASTTT